jgi:hypothetical protein
VITDAHQRDATAIWSVFAHTHDLRDYAPILIVKSPMRRCGKTTLLETLQRVAPKPQPTLGRNAPVTRPERCAASMRRKRGKTISRFCCSP